MQPPAFVLSAVASPNDRPALMSAAEQLSSSVSHALGRSWPAHVQFLTGGSDVPPAGTLVVAMMTSDVDSAEPIEQISKKWRDWLARVQSAGAMRVIFCTVFRCMASHPERARRLYRIRELNRLIVELSQEFGSEVADVDRLLAWCGGEAVQADYRLQSGPAAAIAGHVVTAAILDGEMGGDVASEVQQRAAALHGGVRDMPTVIKRHVQGAAVS